MSHQIVAALDPAVALTATSQNRIRPLSFPYFLLLHLECMRFGAQEERQLLWRGPRLRIVGRRRRMRWRRQKRR